jgi:hypothetical protein
MPATKVPHVKRRNFSRQPRLPALVHCRTTLEDAARLEAIATLRGCKPADIVRELLSQLAYWEEGRPPQVQAETEAETAAVAS